MDPEEEVRRIMQRTGMILRIVRDRQPGEQRRERQKRDPKAPAADRKHIQTNTMIMTKKR